jgi:hypothetical protein
MEVSGHLHGAAALPPGKQLPVLYDDNGDDKHLIKDYTWAVHTASCYILIQFYFPH